MSPNSVSLDTFLQACECALNHLQADFHDVARSVRATCRSGRMLYDRHIKKLVPKLWDDMNGAHQPASPGQLCQSTKNFVDRGTRPSCLHLQYVAKDMEGAVSRWPPDVRGQQLVAVLDGLSSCPPSSLQLSGGIPHSKAVSKAVADRCPNLTQLSLNYDCNDLPSQAEGASGKREYAAGVKSLLKEVGPRLRELTVVVAPGWPAAGLSALQGCTALTSLNLRTAWGTGAVAEQKKLLSTMCKLTQLRSLRLELSLGAGSCTLYAMRQHATVLVHLSTLTALTSLDLELPSCYEPAGDSWQRQLQDGHQHAAWEEVREAHRTAVLSALRCMPQLQDLICRKLWLRPSDLASLTASLTSLILGGLLPPEQQQQDSSSAAASCTLPPQLRTLALAGGASPSCLAAFQPPPSLMEINVSCIRFGRADVSLDCWLRPQAARDVSAAAELLARSEPRACKIVADCGNGPMQPPGGAADGHEPWIRGLEPLGTWLEDLTMRGVQLLVGDVVCFASMLPKLRALELSKAHVPLGALHALTGLTQLERLTLDLTHCRRLTTADLTALLALLCRAMPSLSSAVVTTYATDLDAGACAQGVRQLLGRWGVRPPTIEITNAFDSDSDSDSDGSDGSGDSESSYSDDSDTDSEGY